MKKNVLVVTAVFYALTVTAQTNNGCNTNTHGWGTSLGTVSFKSTRTWKIGNQEWSDIVTATNCQKDTQNGGVRNNFNADCHSINFFTWCAIVRFQKQLCPHGWRVPTVADFVALDLALGGTGENRESSDFMRYREQMNKVKMEHWWTWDDRSEGGRYWSVSRSNDPTKAFALSPSFGPSTLWFKESALLLRCVRTISGN